VALARLPVFAVAAAVAGIAVGCSDDSHHAPRAAGQSGQSHAPAAPPGRYGDVQVIRRCADALRAGHPERSARYFAVPAIVQNVTPPQELGSRAAVVAFNRSLPCGGKVVHTRAAGRYVVALFELTDRPGGNCGDGTGHTAATAFRIRHRRILEWLRVPVQPEDTRPNRPPKPGKERSREI
jgi:hypothetical protein